jgi:predicted dehydrogenase
MDEPLRVGILGGARINDLSILEPARATGARLVAFAARDRSRAESYAQAHGIERVLDSYADVVNDPEVEAVYNPLPNSMHAPWNIAAIRAGKHVLTEKPFASNAAEAQTVQRAAEDADVVVFEGFHYAYHPIFARLLEVITDGTLGSLQHFHVAMEMPAPDPSDLRWSWSLSGGSLMDLGCYCLHAIRTLGTRLGGEPTLTSVDATERQGLTQVDERALASFELPGGATATGLANLDGDWNFSMTATGSLGRALLVNFIHVHEDDRLILTTHDGERVEHLGTKSTYTYQLEAFTAAVREGRPFLTTPSDAVANMHLIDACYRVAGLHPRESTSIASVSAVSDLDAGRAAEVGAQPDVAPFTSAADIEQRGGPARTGVSIGIEGDHR